MYSATWKSFLSWIFRLSFLKYFEDFNVIHILLLYMHSLTDCREARESKLFICHKPSICACKPRPKSKVIPRFSLPMTVTFNSRVSIKHQKKSTLFIYFATARMLRVYAQFRALSQWCWRSNSESQHAKLMLLLFEIFSQPLNIIYFNF